MTETVLSTLEDVTDRVRRSVAAEFACAGWFDRVEARWVSQGDDGTLWVAYSFGTDSGDLAEDVTVTVVARDADGLVLGRHAARLLREGFTDRGARWCRLPLAARPDTVDLVPALG